MRRRIFSIGFLIVMLSLSLFLIEPFFQPKTHATPVLDQYGARTDVSCLNTTGHMILEKVGTRWYFCDVLGHGLIAMSVANIVTNGNPTNDCNGVNTSPIYTTKYGDTTFNWGWQTLKRAQSFNFNSIGQDSAGSEVAPWATCTNCVWPGGVQPVPMPFISEQRPAEDGGTNAFGFLATSPIKDLISMTDSHYSGFRGGSTYDIFDPGLNTEWTGELNGSGTTIQKIRGNNPYIIAVFTDDSDWFSGSGATPDFLTGNTTFNLAWLTLISSPVQVYSNLVAAKTSAKFLYGDPVNHAKSDATNPTTPCSISSPCSLRDYLWQKYTQSGTLTNAQGIAAMDNAWGSNYDSFDSDGTQISGESIGTGDGTTTTFTHTLAHGAIDPYSVQISVGGTVMIGDCPFRGTCLNPPANTGTFNSPTANFVTQSTSTINYSTGAVTITFVNPPALNAAISANYIFGGWNGGGKGLMDENGAGSWVGTNQFCVEGADPNYPTYFSCVGGGGLNNPVPNANSNTGADLDTWESEFAARYFKTLHDGLRAVSNVPYFGLDTSGAFGVPPFSKFLQGEAPYVDGIFTTLTNWNISTAQFTAEYDYVTRYLGDLPLMTFNIITAQNDSSESCHALSLHNDFATQEIRGNNYYNNVSYLLSHPGHNETFPLVGFDFWTWQDFSNTNFGIISLHENAYDGVEDVTSSVPCDTTYVVQSGATCGGEVATYGNALTETNGIRDANGFWLTLPANSTPPPPRPARIIIGGGGHR